METIAKKGYRKFAAMLLSAAMILSAFPAFTAQAFAATASNSSDIAVGDFVDIGKADAAGYTGTPHWRVLDKGEDGSLLLMSEDLWKGNGTNATAPVTFGTNEAKDYAWRGSKAETWCNDFEAAVLDGVEGMTIQPTTKSDAEFVYKSELYTESQRGKYYTEPVDSILYDNKVFFLSAEEAAQYMKSPADRKATFNGEVTPWLLRSSQKTMLWATQVRTDGEFQPTGAKRGGAARPAFWALFADDVNFTATEENGQKTWTVAAPAAKAEGLTVTNRLDCKEYQAEAVEWNSESGMPPVYVARIPDDNPSILINDSNFKTTDEHAYVPPYAFSAKKMDTAYDVRSCSGGVATQKLYLDDPDAEDSECDGLTSLQYYWEDGATYGFLKDRQVPEAESLLNAIKPYALDPAHPEETEAGIVWVKGAASKENAANGAKDYILVLVMDPNAQGTEAHAWGEEASWDWTGSDAEGYTAAKASFTCQTQKTHKTSVDATVSKEKKDGNMVYTATVSFNGKTYTDSKSVALPVETSVSVKNTRDNKTYQAESVKTGAGETPVFVATVPDNASVEISETGFKAGDDHKYVVGSYTQFAMDTPFDVASCTAGGNGRSLMVGDPDEDAGIANLVADWEWSTYLTGHKLPTAEALYDQLAPYALDAKNPADTKVAVIYVKDAAANGANDYILAFILKPDTAVTEPATETKVSVTNERDSKTYQAEAVKTGEGETPVFVAKVPDNASVKINEEGFKTGDDHKYVVGSYTQFGMDAPFDVASCTSGGNGRSLMIGDPDEDTGIANLVADWEWSTYLTGHKLPTAEALYNQLAPYALDAKNPADTKVAVIYVKDAAANGANDYILAFVLEPDTKSEPVEEPTVKTSVSVTNARDNKTYDAEAVEAAAGETPVFVAKVPENASVKINEDGFKALKNHKYVAGTVGFDMATAYDVASCTSGDQHRMLTVGDEDGNGLAGLVADWKAAADLKDSDIPTAEALYSKLESYALDSKNPADTKVSVVYVKDAAANGAKGYILAFVLEPDTTPAEEPSTEPAGKAGVSVVDRINGDKYAVKAVSWNKDENVLPIYVSNVPENASVYIKENGMVTGKDHKYVAGAVTEFDMETPFDVSSCTSGGATYRLMLQDTDEDYGVEGLVEDWKFGGKLSGRTIPTAEALYNKLLPYALDSKNPADTKLAVAWVKDAATKDQADQGVNDYLMVFVLDADAKPVADTPVVDEPVVEEPTVQEPATVKPAKKAKTITVNSKTVSAKTISAAAKKAGTSSKYVTKIVLGKNVKKISKSAFKSYKKVTVIELKTKKLTKKNVKASLKSSKVKTVKVKVGSKGTNKKYAKKYKKYFTSKNAGKKVRVKY